MVLNTDINVLSLNLIKASKPRYFQDNNMEHLNELIECMSSSLNYTTSLPTRRVIIQALYLLQNDYDRISIISQ